MKDSMSYINDLEHYGFAVLEDFVDSATIEVFLQELANISSDSLQSQRAGKAFAMRYGMKYLN